MPPSEVTYDPIAAEWHRGTDRINACNHCRYMDSERCNNPQIGIIGVTCKAARKPDMACGPEARLMEFRQP